MATARAALGAGTARTGQARVEAMLREHHTTLLWVARRWSGSADEAEDALQRAMEIYIRRLDAVDPATELAWLKVVVRHEAMALRRGRGEGVPLDADGLAERVPAPDVAIQERIEREERVARSREALAQLKPDERTALLLKAEGFSYREIGERQGWTYTKVNRAITEGRRRFLQVFQSIEAGEECERFAPTLRALAHGAAESADVVALRPHLRHCAACRATVRELHASRLHRLALHLPLLAGVAPARWLGDRIVDVPDPSRRPAAGARELAHGILNRLTGPDAVTGVQLASSGGGRGPAVAALLGLCLSGGAGTYCLATGTLPRPPRILSRADAPKEKQEAKSRPKPREDRAATPSPTAAPAAVPASTAPEPPARRPVAVVTREPEPEAKKPAPRKRPKRQERRTIVQEEFGFEAGTGAPAVQSAPTGSSAPTASAATATAATNSSSPSGGGGAASSASPPTSGGEFLP